MVNDTHTSIKSPLSLLLSSVVNPNFLNLVLYFNSEKLFIILVVVFAPFLKYLSFLSMVSMPVCNILA